MKIPLRVSAIAIAGRVMPLPRFANWNAATPSKSVANERSDTPPMLARRAYGASTCEKPTRNQPKPPNGKRERNSSNARNATGRKKYQDSPIRFRKPRGR